MFGLLRFSLMIFCCVMCFASSALSASRVKDIVTFEGIRDNMLVGYGLVVGLNGTGDNLKNSPFTEKGVAEFLSKIGVNTRGTPLKTKNVAAVTVTGTLAPFARTGSRFTVRVDTLGDAKSLEGGTLLATPLMAADGNVYALAQGSISQEGLITNASSSNAKNRGMSTSGMLTNGAIVEREIDFDLRSMSQLKLALRNPDISTARRISERINDLLGQEAAVAMDPGTVNLTVPDIYGDNVIGLLADVEQLVVQPDQMARVVIDEASGTIVMGEDVRIDTVAVAQGNLLVTVRSSSQLVQADNVFAGDGEVEVSSVSAQISKNTDPGNGLAILPQGASLRDLVAGLNSLGVGTRDLITILQSIKLAGALHADIEVR